MLANPPQRDGPGRGDSAFVDGNAWRGLKVDDAELQLRQEIILALSLVFEALLQHEQSCVDLPVEKGLLVKTTL